MAIDSLDDEMLNRRGLLAFFAALFALFVVALPAWADPPRRHRRRHRHHRGGRDHDHDRPRRRGRHGRRRHARVHRRAGQRVRRPFVQEVVSGRSLVVVPVDIDADDVLVMEGDRVANVVESRPSNGTILVEIDGREREFDAQFRGSIGPRFAGS